MISLRVFIGAREHLGTLSERVDKGRHVRKGTHNEYIKDLINFCQHIVKCYIKISIYSGKLYTLIYYFFAFNSCKCFI